MNHDDPSHTSLLGPFTALTSKEKNAAGGDDAKVTSYPKHGWLIGDGND